MSTKRIKLTTAEKTRLLSYLKYAFTRFGVRLRPTALSKIRIPLQLLTPKNPIFRRENAIITRDFYDIYRDDDINVPAMLFLFLYSLKDSNYCIIRGGDRVLLKKTLEKELAKKFNEDERTRIFEACGKFVEVLLSPLHPPRKD